MKTRYDTKWSRLIAFLLFIASINSQRDQLKYVYLHIHVFCLGLPHWVSFYLSGSVEESEGELYIHFKSNQKIYVAGTYTVCKKIESCDMHCVTSISGHTGHNIMYTRFIFELTHAVHECCLDCSQLANQLYDVDTQQFCSTSCVI